MGSPARLTTTAAVSARMSRQRRRDTSPELELRRELHRRGLRFRIHYPVPGRSRRSVDVAFTRRKVAVFVDGCFWHACPEHATWPRANGPWWERKLANNVARDADTDECLEAAGWAVVRIWEHTPPDQAADAVVAALAAR